MNLQEELKSLKERIAELEEQANGEQEFPRNDDDYWMIDDRGELYESVYVGHRSDVYRKRIGNIYRTEEEAEFALEKTKVEAEIRKFSRPFKEDENNYFIELYLFDKTLSIDSSEYFQTQGTIYFESAKVANEATDTIGADRIKKYIFGVEG